MALRYPRSPFVEYIFYNMLANRYLSIVSISSYIHQGNKTVRKPVNNTDRSSANQLNRQKGSKTTSYHVKKEDR